MKRFYIFILAGILLPGSVVCAQPPTKSQIESLKGISEIKVVVVNLGPDANRAGLNKSMIKTDVELRLRKHGIKILPDEEFGERQAVDPYLYIDVNLYKRRELFAFTVIVELKQLVSLERRPQTVLIAPTWSRSATGMVGSANLRLIRESVLDFVDTFCNNYLSMNK